MYKKKKTMCIWMSPIYNFRDLLWYLGLYLLFGKSKTCDDDYYLTVFPATKESGCDS